MTTVGWIATKDRMPQDDEDVLVVGLFGPEMDEASVFVAYWNGRDWNDLECQWDVVRITHWQPLPKLPTS